MLYSTTSGGDEPNDENEKAGGQRGMNDDMNASEIIERLAYESGEKDTLIRMREMLNTTTDVETVKKAIDKWLLALARK